MNIREKILVVEDEKSIAQFIAAVLDGQGYETIQARTGAEGLSMISSHCPDLVILDLGLPDMDGLDILRQLRSWSSLPVVVVSARSHERDKVTALDQGADDYLTKPFNPVTLGAKVKALIRRSRGGMSGSSGVISAGPFRYDTSTLRFYKDGREIVLSSKENAIMKLFLDNVDRIFTKDMIYDMIWGSAIVDENAIMVYINRLRQKIEEDPARPAHIQTVRGLGYRFVV